MVAKRSKSPLNVSPAGTKATKDMTKKEFEKPKKGVHSGAMSKGKDCKY
jgi:hypothetical protein